MLTQYGQMLLRGWSSGAPAEAVSRKTLCLTLLGTDALQERGLNLHHMEGGVTSIKH